MENASVEQNSAVMLSVWHCILAWFLNSEESRREDKDILKDMAEIYRNMKSLRLAVQNKVDEKDPNVESMAKLITGIYSRVPQDQWMETINSMIRELRGMHGVLEQHEYTMTDDLDMSVQQDQGIHLIYMLTVWYWLAACSSSHNQHQEMDTFLHAFECEFESESETERPNLSFLLLSNVPSLENYQNRLCDLMSKLHEMLRSNPRHWVHALDLFILQIREAGKLRGLVKEDKGIGNTEEEYDEMNLIINQKEFLATTSSRNVLNKMLLVRMPGHGGSPGRRIKPKPKPESKPKPKPDDGHTSKPKPKPKPDDGHTPKPHKLHGRHSRVKEYLKKSRDIVISEVVSAIVNRVVDEIFNKLLSGGSAGLDRTVIKSQVEPTVKDVVAKHVDQEIEEEVDEDSDPEGSEEDVKLDVKSMIKDIMSQSVDDAVAEGMKKFDNDG